MGWEELLSFDSKYINRFVALDHFHQCHSIENLGIVLAMA